MTFDPRQIRMFAVLLIGIVMLLAGIWYFLLRTEYAAIYQNIRESDASQIVAELDSAGIPYKLANNGHDVLVPEGQAADARVAVAGADIAMGGTTGFELFNENDLGLTEFAQKINLQRAIQGELARTIMMMDGVRFARVHLALPERTLFRAEQEVPTAAVTVEMRSARTLSGNAVKGIRQLVASSVPGLDVANVSVLDDHGGLVNAPETDNSTYTIPVQSERQAFEALLKIQATNAVAEVIPRQSFTLDISAFDKVEATEDETAANDEESSAQIEQLERGLRDRSLRVLVRSPVELSADERLDISGALARKIDLSTESGDVLDFTTGVAIERTDQSISDPHVTPPVTVAGPETAKDSTPTSWLSLSNLTAAFSSWQFFAAIALIVVLMAARPRRQLSDPEAEQFADLLRDAAIDLKAR